MKLPVSIQHNQKVSFTHWGRPSVSHATSTIALVAQVIVENVRLSKNDEARFPSSVVENTMTKDGC